MFDRQPRSSPSRRAREAVSGLFSEDGATNHRSEHARCLAGGPSEHARDIAASEHAARRLAPEHARAHAGVGTCPPARRPSEDRATRDARSASAAAALAAAPGAVRTNVRTVGLRVALPISRRETLRRFLGEKLDFPANRD